jgi:hypothetical protein
MNFGMAIIKDGLKMAKASQITTILGGCDIPVGLRGCGVMRPMDSVQSLDMLVPNVLMMVHCGAHGLIARTFGKL